MSAAPTSHRHVASLVPGSLRCFPAVWRDCWGWAVKALRHGKSIEILATFTMIWASLSIECHPICAFIAAYRCWCSALNKSGNPRCTHPFCCQTLKTLWRMDECLRCLSLPLVGEFEGKVPEIESKQPSHFAAFGFKFERCRSSLWYDFEWNIRGGLPQFCWTRMVAARWKQRAYVLLCDEAPWNNLPLVITDNSAEKGWIQNVSNSCRLQSSL